MSTSPYLNRFIQPDTIIPDLSNPQSWNRYSYVTNRPIVANDPTGHKCVGEVEECLAFEGKPINGSGGGNDGGDGDEEKEGQKDIDNNPSYGICIAGGFVNPEGADSGTGTLCQDLKDEKKINAYEVGNAYSDWRSFYTNNSELLVDYNLVIIGYSNGGPAALELAYYLNSVDRDVSYLFLIDPVKPSADHRAIPGNVQNSYLLLEDGEETGIDIVADLATHNNYINGVDYITNILNANHGNVDELSIDIISYLLP